ncbi:MAG: transporter substrate-binding domain-containing protein [Pseudomonadota bacterium]
MHSGNFWKRFIFIAVMVLLIAAPATAQNIQQQLMAESMIQSVIKRGVLRVGMDTFVPWAMKDKTGTLIGFEIDVATRLAADLGVKVEFVPTKWAGIIPALLTGKFDIVVGGMSVTPERNKSINFTIPYYYTGMSMVASRKLADGFTSLEDFNKPDVVLAVRMGSTQVLAAKKYMPKAALRQFDGEAQAYQEVINGKAHAAVGSAPTPSYQAIKYPDQLFLPLEDTFTREPIAFAVRKGDPDSLNYLDNWIRVVQAEDWIQDRKHYWFGTQDWKSMMK